MGLHELGEPVRALVLADVGSLRGWPSSGCGLLRRGDARGLRRTVVVEDATTMSLWERGRPGCVRCRGPWSAWSREHWARPGRWSCPEPAARHTAAPAAPAGGPGRGGVGAVVLDLDDEPLAGRHTAVGPSLLPTRTNSPGCSASSTTLWRHAGPSRPGLERRWSILGQRGLLGHRRHDQLAGVAPRSVAGHPIGAGDAVTAASPGPGPSLAWPDILCDAVALGTAAVAEPTAGEVDLGGERVTSCRVLVEVVDPTPVER